MTKEFEQLIRKVEQWAIANGLTPSPLTKTKQALCVVEETYEFCEDPSLEEAGDIQVTLIILAYLYGFDPVELYKTAERLSFIGIEPFSLDKRLLGSSAVLAQFVRKNKTEDLSGEIKVFLSFLLDGLPMVAIDPYEALLTAYEKISQRKVKKIGGTLVKEQDIL